MAESIPKLKEGEQSGSQVMNRIASIAAGVGLLGAMPLGVSMPYLMGGGLGTMANPCGFPGYGQGYYGTYGTYRQILCHPIVRMVRSIVHGPILMAPWYTEVPSDVDPEIGKAVDKEMNRIRGQFVAEALRSLDYGWAGFEPVWAVVDGEWTIERIKPLLVDTTQIIVDRNGNFAGLRTNSGSGYHGPIGFLAPTELNKGDLRRKDGKALIVTHDGEAGNLYGRSRLENFRDTAYKDWLDCAQQLQAIGGKLSGRSGVIKCPVGEYIDPSTGEKRQFRDDAVLAAEAFKNGQTVILTNLSMSADDPDLMAKLAGTALVTFDVVDFGETAQAIGGLLDRMRHNEELMYNGYLRSSRTGAESQHGSRADSEQHSDSGTIDSQLIGNMIAEAAQPLVDIRCAVNNGLKPGTIRLRQSPLVDTRVGTYKDLLKTISADPTVVKTLVKVADMDKVVDGLDIPRDGDWDKVAQEVQAEADEKAAMEADQQHEKALALTEAKGKGPAEKDAQ